MSQAFPQTFLGTKVQASPQICMVTLCYAKHSQRYKWHTRLSSVLTDIYVFIRLNQAFPQTCMEAPCLVKHSQRYFTLSCLKRSHRQTERLGIIFTKLLLTADFLADPEAPVRPASDAIAAWAIACCCNVSKLSPLSLMLLDCLSLASFSG